MERLIAIAVLVVLFVVRFVAFAEYEPQNGNRLTFTVDLSSNAYGRVGIITDTKTGREYLFFRDTECVAITPILPASE